jgi:hypothetical protein
VQHDLCVNMAIFNNRGPTCWDISNLVSVVHVIGFLENLMSTVIRIGIRNR